MAARRTFTATGIIRLAPDMPVEAIGSALMDSAADLDDNSAVSIDLAASVVEIEVIVATADVSDAAATAKSLINRICDRADFDVEFEPDRRPRPAEWHLVDNASQPPQLLTAG